MSIFIADTSTQGTGGLTSATFTYPTKTYPNLKMNTNCGIYNSGDNTIKIFTNGIDALTIDASQKVSCDGSLITNVNYNNLTNKPDFSIYLTSANASSTYATISSLSSYLTTANASTTYATITSLSSYLTTANASSTYLTIANASSTYLTSANAGTTYATSANLTTTSNNLYTSSSNYTYTTSNICIDYNNHINRPNLSLYLTTANASSTYLTTATASSTYATITNLNTKENALTFNAPLTRTTNAIGLSYDASLGLNGTQLKVANPSLWVQRTNASGGATMDFTAGVGGINPTGTGFVGIGSTDPQQRLDVLGTINSSAGYTISAGSTANAGLTWNNFGVSAVACAGTAGSYSTSANAGDLVIRSDTGKQLILQNGSGSSGICLNSGNIGMGITNPLRKLHLNAPTDVGVYLQFTNLASGTTAGDGCIFGMDATTLNFALTNNENGDMYFLTNGTERMRIKNTGNVGIGLNNPNASYKLDVNGALNATEIYKSGINIRNHIYNNSGNNHGDASDFNTPTEFGYHYIMGNTNGPGVNGAGQYYSWIIGLGANYAWTGAGSYGCQFALPRNVGNPYLCVRYKENNGLGSWNKISAGYADNVPASGITGQTGMWTSATRPGPYRLYRRDDNSDYSVQTYWTGSRWRLYGYNGDSAHADTHTGYADSAGTAYGISSSDSTIGGVRLFSDGYGANISMNSWKWWCFGTGFGNVIALSSPVDYRYCFPTQSGYALQNMSDERIKKQIKRIKGEKALEQLLLLEPIEYQHCKDKDADLKIGLRAQQVKKHFKNLVCDNNEEFVANILSNGKIDNRIITLEKDISNIINIDDKIKIVMDNPDGKEIMLNSSDNKYKRRYAKVIKIISNFSFEIDGDIDVEKVIENIFVFGTLAKDIHTIDYNSVFTLNVCATQELYKMIKEQQTLISNLQAELTEIKAKLN